MGFSCPICSEKLDKLPAEAQDRPSAGAEELNISATPCGHIFHDYCIKKWLSGNFATSKQCPCCRIDVPRCLSLFPTSYDDSGLDDSMSGSPGNPGEIIAILKAQVARLESDFKEKEQMYNVLGTYYDTLHEKYRAEKLTSDTWMMRANEYERYKDLADETEKRLKAAEAQLKTYKSVDDMIRGVEVAVNEDLPNFPPTEESLRSLIEMKNILAKELKKKNHKYNELRSDYENLKSEKMKLKRQFDVQQQEFEELKHVHEISRANGRIRSTSPVAGTSHGFNSSTTATGFHNKRRFQEQLSSASLEAKMRRSGDVDAGVDVLPSALRSKKVKAAKGINFYPRVILRRMQGSTFNEKEESSTSGKAKTSVNKSKASSKFLISRSPVTETTDTPTFRFQNKSNNSTIDICSDSSFEDDDDLRIRGSVPDAPLPIAANRTRNLQKRSKRPVLRVSSKAKFSYKKS